MATTQIKNLGLVFVSLLLIGMIAYGFWVGIGPDPEQLCQKLYGVSRIVCGSAVILCGTGLLALLSISWKE